MSINSGQRVKRVVGGVFVTLALTVGWMIFYPPVHKDAEPPVLAVSKPHGVGVPPVPPAEGIAIQATLLRLDPASASAQAELLDFSRKYTGKLRTSALLPLLLFCPSLPEVQRRAHEVIESESEPELMAAIVRALSAVKDPWLPSRMALIYENPSADLKRAVVQSLHVACPDERWQILDLALRGPKRELLFQAAIEALKSAPGAKSKGLVSAELSRANDPEKKAELVSVNEFLSQVDAVDPCEN